MATPVACVWAGAMSMAGWQKQGHTWHIVPRNYSSKVGLIDLIMKKIWEKRRKLGGKQKNQKD